MEQENVYIFEELRVFFRSYFYIDDPTQPFHGPGEIPRKPNLLLDVKCAVKEERASLFQHVATVIQLCLNKRAQNATARTDVNRIRIRQQMLI